MKEKIKGLSMQKKMILSYAVPIILIYILVNTVCYHFITIKYEEQIRHSMKQSSQQAVSFLESYVQNMQHLANMIENNGGIQSTLNDEAFEAELPMDEEYREFWRLNECFSSLELSNQVYHLGLYVDERKSYSSNHMYFFEESLVKDREDYKNIEEYLGKNQMYLTLSKERNEPFIVMLKRIYSQDVMKRPMNICSVSVKQEKFVQLIQNANVTGEGVVYLVNQNNQIILSSNNERMKQIGEEELPRNGKETEWEKVGIGDESFFLIRRDIGNVDWQMISLIPWKEYWHQQNFIRIFQYMMVGIIMFVVSGASYLLSKYYVGRLASLKQKMSVIQKGNLNVWLPMEEDKSKDEVDEIFKNFNFMVEELRRLMQEHFRLGKEVKKSELKALQSQINPHFLYNTLDLINWMALDYGASEIENIVWNLSRFYRLSLNKGKNILTVSEEVEHVQVYLAIENIHFDQAIHFEIDVPEEVMDKACLNIILQPLVENAIVHGIAEVPEIDHMNIFISAAIDQQDIVFCVKDDGVGMSQELIQQLEMEYMNTSGKGYGVRNINFRIKLCFGEQYGIHYESMAGQGTTAYIRIPMLEYEEAEKVIGNS